MIPLFLTALNGGVYTALIHFADSVLFQNHTFWLFLVSTLHISFAVFCSGVLLLAVIRDYKNYARTKRTILFLQSDASVEKRLEVFKKVEQGAALYTFNNKEVSIYMAGNFVLLSHKQKMLFEVIDTTGLKTKSIVLDENSFFGVRVRATIVYTTIYNETDRLLLDFDLKKGEYDSFYQFSTIFDAIGQDAQKNGVRIQDLESLSSVKSFKKKHQKAADLQREQDVKEYLGLIISLDGNKEVNRQTLAYAIAETILSQNQELRTRFAEVEEMALELEDTCEAFGTAMAYDMSWEAFVDKIKSLK